MSGGTWLKLDAIPPSICCIDDYERHFFEAVPADLAAYFGGGCGSENALRRNREVFGSWSILPRVLSDMRDASTKLALLGMSHASPILLAPVAHQGLLDAEGEMAIARAADATDVTMVLSTLASSTLEDVAEVTEGAKWFQLYWQERREHTLELLHRAEVCGYKAIVLTVDVPIQAMRHSAQRAGFTLPGHAAANLRNFTPPPKISLAPGSSIVFQGVMASAPSWQDVTWLCRETSLPIVVKGILRPDDAVRAFEAGASAVVVSNHGGRSLDSNPTALEMLPFVRAAVGRAAPLLMDGGVRSGEDVFKSLALGADAVLLGRPQVYALAVAGALGVAHMLRNLRMELEVVMSLTGCVSLADIDEHSLWRERGAG